MRHQRLLCAGAVLFSTLALSRAANCTAKFEGLVTCAVLNGVPASGTPAQLGHEAMALLDQEVMDRYSLDRHSSGLISQSEMCAAIYAKFQCVHRTAERVTSDAGVGYQHAAPCNDTGARMLPCYQWCAEYMAVCIPTMPLKYVTDLCTMYSAPRTDACFGSNGRLGMLPPWKEAADSGAHSPQAPSWVGMLAIAVMHYLLN